MSGISNDGIILCQPDNIKGCSLCCGLFNFSDISSASLSRFLKEGESREKAFSSHETFKSPVQVRDKFSHICPYQGFLKDNKPGCLIHPLSSGVDGRDRSLFAGKICDRFFCPAHTILSEEEKQFLIENVTDWYLYCTAIADPESYSFIYNYVKENWTDSELCAVLIKEGLTVHTFNLAANTGVVFCYSIPEYNINKENFCIRYKSEKRDLVVSRINNLSQGLK
jgi:hypothetical protein